jgi:transposase InsO family protein
MIASLATQGNSNSTWYIDSGASQHMTYNKHFFNSLEETKGARIFLGDDSSHAIEGIGSISMKGNDGKKLEVADVNLVPKLTKNIFSVSQITQHGYKVDFYLDKCLIKNINDGFKIVATGVESDGIYKFLASVDKKAYIATNSSISELWHQKYGHLNYQSLSMLSKINMVDGLPWIRVSTNVCTRCMVGKQHRDKFERSRWRASKSLELVHRDLRGPMNPPSKGGAKYILTFIDDFSRKFWVYFLKQKDEVFSKFEIFKALVENQSENKIKRIRTDNGGEYVNNKFKYFCEYHGIKREMTNRYTPQQNGVAERKNRTLVEMAWCMLQSKGLPLFLWAEAIDTTSHVLNRSPTTCLENITSEEAWCGKKPDVKYFKVLGCEAFAYILDEIRENFFDKSVKCIFVGYDDQRKGYRLYDPSVEDVFTSRDVNFNEGFEDMIPSSLIPQVDIDNGESSKSFEISQGSSSAVEESTPPPKTKSLQEIYQKTQQFNYALMTTIMKTSDPQTYGEAKGQHEWEQAMENEYDSLIKNKTWELVDLPKGKNVVNNKWVYKTKFKSDGSIEKHKARLVAKGYSQKYLNLLLTYSPPLSVLILLILFSL